MNNEQSIRVLLAGNARAVALTGSRAICNPPPMDTDEDYMVLVHGVETAQRALMAAGWEVGGSSNEEDFNVEHEPFISFRKGELNIILTWDEEFYRKMAAYTFIAEHLNVLVKADRVALSQAIRKAPKFYVRELDELGAGGCP